MTITDTPVDSDDSSDEQQPHMAYWAKARQAFLQKVRDSGRTVTEKEPSDSTEFTATFPQGRPPVAKRKAK